MDVLIAVVRVRVDGQKQRNFLSPSDYDLLVIDEELRAADTARPRTSSCATQSLLICRAQRGEDSVEAALRYVAQLDKSLARRAVPVALCDGSMEQPCSSSQSPLYYPLVCVPVLESSVAWQENAELGLRFCDLSQLVNDSLNGDPSIDGQSRNLIIRVEEWLSQEQRHNISFISRLFAMESAASRIKFCSHSPAYNPRLLYFCHRAIDRSNEGEKMGERSSELEEAVKMSNTVRARMIEMEKYDRYQINPIFGVGTSYKRRETAPVYFARGRKAICKRSPGLSLEQRSPTEFWEQQFPLHKFAFDGDHDKVLDLLNKGYNPNELDNDFWTPLHYCAFYNRFKACEMLMTHPKTNVNAVNKTGATALHFAALNGNAYLVELILSHQFIDIMIKDSYGKTPLELCERVPKPDWQDAALLLRKQLRPNKIEVQLIGGPALQVEVRDAFDATAGELRENVLAREGLSQSAGRIFAIWITSQRLSLQLKAEQKVKIHLDKWPEHLEKWGDPPAASEMSPHALAAEDDARIVLRRDARTLLGDEQVLARKSPVAISFLYSEAEKNFLAGLYPCNEKFYVQLAAIILQRLYGDGHIAIDAVVLSHILPRHLIPPASDVRALQSLAAKVTQAHKHFHRTNLVQLQLIFLKYCWSLNVYGCTFFKAYMLMSKPLRGNISVHVGLNDWGMSVINATTFKQVAALELKNLDVKYRPNSNFIEISNRKRDFAATVTTPQAMLINNLLKQLKTKVEAANAKSSNSSN